MQFASVLAFKNRRNIKASSHKWCRVEQHEGPEIWFRYFWLFWFENAYKEESQDRSIEEFQTDFESSEIFNCASSIQKDF